MLWDQENSIFTTQKAIDWPQKAIDNQNVYIDKLDDTVNKYNKTYHSTIKIKLADVKSKPYIDSSKEINNKHPKFKISDILRISKYKNIFTKDYTPN